MKYILSLLAALCLVSGTVLAQPGGGNGPNGPGNRPAFGQKPGGGKPEGAPPASGPSKPAPSQPNRPPHHRPPQHRPPDQRPPHHRPPDQRPPHKPTRPGHTPPRPGNGWHHRPPPRPGFGWEKPRHDQWFWRGHWLNRLRAASYAFPRGYNYRHWAVGQRLPGVFLGASYFYDNVAPLGLEVPPPGYRWVRYGPDLFLVNLATGDIEETAYGVFY